jgi:hypothetical protein
MDRKVTPAKLDDSATSGDGVLPMAPKLLSLGILSVGLTSPRLAA